MGPKMGLAGAAAPKSRAVGAYLLPSAIGVVGVSGAGKFSSPCFWPPAAPQKVYQGPGTSHRTSKLHILRAGGPNVKKKCIEERLGLVTLGLVWLLRGATLQLLLSTPIPSGEG